MRPTALHRPRRHASIHRHRPRMPVLAAPSPADDVRASDLVMAVTGVAMLGGFCLALAGNLITF